MFNRLLNWLKLKLEAWTQKKSLNISGKESEKRMTSKREHSLKNLSEFEIDLDQSLPGCKNFTWREALYCPRWNIHAVPTADVIRRITNFAPKVQIVRDFLGLPMLTESWWRPPKYNALIGGAQFSEHMDGGALDFKCPGMSGDQLRHMLQPKLEEFGLRMEDLPGASWVHIDDKEPGNKRFFKP